MKNAGNRKKLFYSATSFVMIVVLGFFQVSCMKTTIREVVKATSTSNNTTTTISTFLKGRLDTAYASATSNIDRFDQGGWEDFAMAIDMQNDGKAVVGQWSNFGGLGVDFVVSRLNIDGTLDLTFGGGNGFVQYDLTGSDDTLNAIKVKPNGKIVAVGTTYSDWEVLQLNTDGTLDTNFNSGITPGWLVQDFGGSTESATALEVLADNSILVVGHSDQSGVGRSTIMKILDDGTPDATYGTGGITELNFGFDADYLNAITLQTDGKSIVAGMTDSSGSYLPAIARLDTSGAVDGTFGLLTPSLGGTSESFSSVIVHNNNVYACGNSDVDGTARPMIAKFDSTGNPDLTFDSDGFKTLAVATAPGLCKSILIDVDGFITVTGELYLNHLLFSYASLYQRIGNLAMNLLSNLFMPSAHAFVVMNHWNVFVASVKQDGSMNSNFGASNVPGVFVKDLGFGLPDRAGGAVLNSEGKVQIAAQCENGTDTDACTFLVK